MPGQFQADGKEKERHTQFGHAAHFVHRVQQAQRVRADQHTCQQIADDGALAEARQQ